jgi:lipopolysaccharide export system protein LptA
VDVTLAPDGTLTSVVARPGPGQHVQLYLPATADSPAKTITAQTLDGTGQPGKGLTDVVLTRDVLYTEAPLRSKTAAADKQTGMRTARSQRLEASLADDAVTEATFSGETTFEETGLKACAARAGYNPRKGTLALSGATRMGPPMVADEQVAIEALTIDVALDTRKMTALGSQAQKLTTFMRSPGGQRCRPSTDRPASQRGANNIPRLLKSDEPTTIVVLAEKDAGLVPRLEYDSEKGLAVYTGGRATLDQEDTSIVANRLVLDQNRADLTATGTAITRMRMDDKMNEGRGHEVRYVDATRELTYASQPKTPGAEVSLVSPGESTLRAGNIVITLAAKENKAETVRARGNVRLADGPQNVSGTTLVYTASNEQFVVRGERGKPAAAASLGDGKCRTSEADSITFQKGSSNVELEGGSRRSRTAPAGSGSASCTPPAPATPPTR